MNFSTRLFKEEDLGACATLFIETFSRPPWNEKWDDPIVHARLKQIFETPFSLGMIIASDSQILGFALGFSEPWHEGPHFYLKEMCVHADFQRQGIGSSLMASLLAQLKEHNTQKIYLLTSRGDLSENFYLKAGFYTSPKMIMMGKYLK